MLEGDQFVYRVYFSQNNAMWPSRIDRVDGKENIRTTTLLEEYKELTAGNSKTSWPTKVIVRSYDRGGHPLAEMNYSIAHLQAGADIPDEEFTIDFTLANNIWDDDNQVFVQNEAGFRLPPAILNPRQAETGTRSGLRRDEPEMASKSNITPEAHAFTSVQHRSNNSAPISEYSIYNWLGWLAILLGGGGAMGVALLCLVKYTKKQNIRTI